MHAEKPSRSRSSVSQPFAGAWCNLCCQPRWELGGANRTSSAASAGVHVAHWPRRLEECAVVEAGEAAWSGLRCFWCARIAARGAKRHLGQGEDAESDAAAGLDSREGSSDKHSRPTTRRKLISRDYQARRRRRLRRVRCLSISTSPLFSSTLSAPFSPHFSTLVLPALRSPLSISAPRFTAAAATLPRSPLSPPLWPLAPSRWRPAAPATPNAVVSQKTTQDHLPPMMSSRPSLAAAFAQRKWRAQGGLRSDCALSADAQPVRFFTAAPGLSRRMALPCSASPSGSAAPA